ncbi:hypothetical protein ACQPYE_18150 [Actinosynnema sp. CA-299493]
MRVTLTNPVAATVDQHGRLLLTVSGTGARHVLEAPHTAMWIALWQHDGDADRAGDALARSWDDDPARIRADLRRWVAHLCAIGLAAET